MNLSAWSVWRILAMWASWLFIVSSALVATIALVVRRLRDRAPVPAPGEGDVMNGFAIPIPASALRVVVILCLMPPILLTVIWVWQRFLTRR